MRICQCWFFSLSLAESAHSLFFCHVLLCSGVECGREWTGSQAAQARRSQPSSGRCVLLVEPGRARWRAVALDSHRRTQEQPCPAQLLTCWRPQGNPHTHTPTYKSVGLVAVFKGKLSHYWLLKKVLYAPVNFTLSGAVECKFEISRELNELMGTDQNLQGSFIFPLPVAALICPHVLHLGMDVKQQNRSHTDLHFPSSSSNSHLFCSQCLSLCPGKETSYRFSQTPIISPQKVLEFLELAPSCARVSFELLARVETEGSVRIC